jgi:uncharacterized membrane protein
MTRLLRLVVAMTIAAYPLLVYFGLRHFEPTYIAVMLVALAMLRLFSLSKSPDSANIHLVLASMLAFTCMYTLLADNPDGFRYYPVAVNLTLLAVFFYSLMYGPPVIERLARLSEPGLPAHAIRYTRKVTEVWCIFFLLNGSVALYTALYSSFENWAYYNGLIAYLMMGVLFTVEWLIRRSIQRKMDATP